MQQTDDHLPIVDDAHVFNIDYFNLHQVKVLANKQGRGLLVVKRPDRANFNIVRVSQEFELPRGTLILHRT